ncbi:MAG: type II methionyl aminopeptidase [Desulfurococcaceae archaeon]
MNILDEYSIKALIRAGKIAREIVKYLEKLIKPGVRLLDIAINIENKIKEQGGEPAFPVNIGINEVAAHYTPLFNDESVIPDNSVVKVDIGVHVDGYIADTAITVSFNPVLEGLVEASRTALEKALELIKPGIKVYEIGKIIEDTIRAAGFKVIKNLSGHSMDRYIIHSGMVIPNHKDVLARDKLETGVYAIEPFATTGIGLVKESSLISIYALRDIKKKAVLPPQARSLYDNIYNARKTLPFTDRWYIGVLDSVDNIRTALYYIEKSNGLVKYPVLIERSRGFVSQFEHTIVVWGKEVIVTTS